MAGVRRLVGVLVLLVVAGLLAASPGLSDSGAPVGVGPGLGSGARLGASAGHAAATASVLLPPGLSTAEIKPLPVAPGPVVPVVVSGVMTQVRASDGKKYCYDAFYYDLCGLTQANGVVNAIWVGPPGWTGTITGTSLLSSLSVPANSPYPAFNPSHVYHLTLNLTGKQLLWAAPHGVVGKDTWSGGLKLDFTGTPTSGGGKGGAPSTPPVIVPTPSGLGQTVTAAAPRPGGAAVVSSPVLGAFRKLIAKVGGVFPGDLAAVAGARKQCFVNFTKGLVDTLQHATPDERTRIKAGFTTDLIALGLGAAGANYKPFDYLLACVAFINGVERVYRAQANGAASSSCTFSPMTLSLSGSGTSTRLKSFDMRGPSALQTSCAASAGGLAIAVAPTSTGTPLSSVVGPRLRLGIARSKKDPPGGQLSITFNQGNSASGPLDITGSWVNNQAPTAGPPWQLTASNGGQTLDAAWTGGAGHTGLHGTFHGSLAQASGASAYTGTFTVTEAGTTVTGTGTFTIDNTNQIEIDLQPTGRPPIHYTFVRAS